MLEYLHCFLLDYTILICLQFIENCLNLNFSVERRYTRQIPHIIPSLLLFDCWISMVIQPRCFWFFAPLFNRKVNSWRLLCLLCAWNPPQIISVPQNSNEQTSLSLPEDKSISEIKKKKKKPYSKDWSSCVYCMGLSFLLLTFYFFYHPCSVFYAEAHF